MIQLNELRIGNKVKSPIVPGAIGTVDGIIPRPKAISIDGVFTSENLEPVPLTPKIMQACGFEFKDMMFANNPMRYWRKDRIIWHSSGGVYLWNEKETELVIKVEYLHQLQNIFFVITGQELSVNLEIVKV